MWDIDDYEHKSQRLAPRRIYYSRLARNVGVALAITVAALAFGMWGFVTFADLTPIDAFLNAAMLLSGMGPTKDYPGFGGKLFGGMFALFSGLFVIIMMTFILAPVFHRVLHQFHVEDDDDKKST
jgi:hypothetical protein